MKIEKEDVKVGDRYEYRLRGKSLEPTCGVLEVWSSLAWKMGRMLFIGRVLVLTPIRTGKEASAVLAFLTSLWNIIFSHFILSPQILLPNCNITGALCGPLPEGGLDHRHDEG